MKHYIQHDIDRKALKKHTKVEIVIEDKEICKGLIDEVLSKTTPKNGKIRVRLTDGKIGTVTKIITPDEVKLEEFKFLNRFFYSKEIYSLYNKKEKTYQLIQRIDKTQNKVYNHILIFSDKELAINTFKNTKYDTKDFCIVKLNRNKRIYENFKNNKIHYVRIDMKKTTSIIKFKKLEDKYLKN